jgi:hypothetical protein
MFDSGSSRSFVKKAFLDQISHLPIQSQKQQYLMADGSTTFQVIGLVRVFIEISQVQTSIVVGVVNSLCVDCILGMDYINKYQVNLNNKRKQVQIHTYHRTIITSMEDPVDDINIICRLNHQISIYPYQEKRIKITLQVSSGQMLFSPVDSIFQEKGLISPNSLITVKHHIAWISIYNSTGRIHYLHRNVIVGMATPLTSTTSISTIFDSQTKEKVDENQTDSLTSIGEQNINNLLSHIQDPFRLKDLQVMLRKHHQLFDTSKVTIADTPIAHVICTGDNPPTASRPYPQTIEKQNATFDIIQQMLKNKQIRASRSQYSAPVLLIKKRDGTYRFVIDYRKLNNITIPDRYPLPNIEQSIQIVGGHQYYSKLDLRAGYFQIPIREEDKHKTAFITVHGLFEFNVLAQGLTNSPPSFQRIMSNLLLPCKPFCFVYLDDVLIYSDNLEQHIHHLNQVLAICNKHKLQLNPQKCELVRTEIDYLGHTINKDGVKPLQARIEKILAIPQPTTLNQANAFIGAIGWYRKFIKDYAKLAAPILAVTNLTTPHKYKFKWDTLQREAFDNLKMAIISEPLFLTYPDSTAPLILSTDASDYCVGGVLYQEINGIRKNVYFYSQMLPKLQRKWPTIEKEALAIYYCVNRMKLYLLGREFIVQTDHCPLRDMHQKPSNNRRVDRISLILQQYNIKEIRHVSGKCNCMADYLSRYPSQLEDDEEFLEDDFGVVPGLKNIVNYETLDNYVNVIPSFVGAVTTRAQAKAQVPESLANDLEIPRAEASAIDDHPHQEEGHEFDISLVADAQKEDKLYQEKIMEINSKSKNTSYVLENEILYKLVKRGFFTQKVIYVPVSMLNQLLKAYHDAPWAGHFGYRRTYLKLKDKYWWPHMKMTIQQHIQTCLKCQRFNVERRKFSGLLHPIEPPKGPCQLIGIDYTGPFPVTLQGNKYVLAITDYFTKWVIAIPLPTQTAQETAAALYEHYICIYGVPYRILSDQGTHFNNQLITAFTQLLGCHHIKSTPYHPQTNGAIERFNSTFERQLAKLTDRQINNWDIHLQSIVFAYNTGQHATTKFSPYELQFGRTPNLPPDKPPDYYEFAKPNDYFRHLQQTIKIYHQHAFHNMKQNQQVYKEQFDRNRPDIHFYVGDQVLKRFPNSPSKLSALYSNPMIVIKKNHPTYWIRDPHTQQHFQVHVSQLRSCHPNRLI